MKYCVEDKLEIGNDVKNYLPRLTKKNIKIKKYDPSIKRTRDQSHNYPHFLNVISRKSFDHFR